jgi:hypothetical protein
MGLVGSPLFAQSIQSQSKLHLKNFFWDRWPGWLCMVGGRCVFTVSTIVLEIDGLDGLLD